MKKKHIITFCLGMAFSMTALAQNKVVTGTVYDETGEPVIGATVQVKGTKTGTVTDIDGNYKLEVPERPRSPSVI